MLKQGTEFRRPRSARFGLGMLLAAFSLQPSAFSFASVPAAAVVTVQPTRVADLVMLDHGFNAGLRQGMVCRISRGTTEVAEVLLVELRPACSAALIVSVAPKQSIRPGDIASIKVLKS